MRKVIAWVKGLFVRAPAGVPDCISDFWYCGEWYLYRSDRHDKGLEHRSDFTAWPVEGRPLFNPYECISGTAGLIDGLIPAFRLGDRVALYRVVSRYRDGGSDLLPWDDGRKITLMFVKTCPAELHEAKYPHCALKGKSAPEERQA